MKNCQNSTYRTWKVALALTGLCTLSACVKTMPLQEFLSSQAELEPTRSAQTPVPIPAPAPAYKPTISVTPSPPVKSPAPVTLTSSANKVDSSASKVMTYAEFLKRLGTQKTSSFVGTSLQLNLKRGGGGGWEGFIQDVQTLVFFSCPTESKFNGGPLLAKIAKIRSNDMGVFVQLDRCDK